MSFHHCTLYLSPRSPFARRVRVAFLEQDLSFREIILDVLKPNLDLIKVNPLARVPTVVLQSGMTLFESHLILQAFYDRHPHPLYPKDIKNQLDLFHWSALATGIADKAIEYFFESSRPKEQQDQDWLSEIGLVTRSTFTSFEDALKKRPFLLGETISQADLDLAIVMEYFSLRVGPSWQQAFPELAKWVNRMGNRESLQKTKPPQH